LGEKKFSLVFAPYGIDIRRVDMVQDLGMEGYVGSWEAETPDVNLTWG
jgi:hypothetical protein